MKDFIDNLTTFAFSIFRRMTTSLAFTVFMFAYFMLLFFAYFMFFLSLMLMSGCSGAFGTADYKLNDGDVRVFCSRECPDRQTMEQFLETEEEVWVTECGVQDFDAALLNIHGRLPIHFTEDLQDVTDSSGRYWPREHIIEVQYPADNWKPVLRHELGLAIGQTQLGYVGEPAKVEWYQCHPNL